MVSCNQPPGGIQESLFQSLCSYCWLQSAEMFPVTISCCVSVARLHVAFVRFKRVLVSDGNESKRLSCSCFASQLEPLV